MSYHSKKYMSLGLESTHNVHQTSMNTQNNNSLSSTSPLLAFLKKIKTQDINLHE